MRALVPPVCLIVAVASIGVRSIPGAGEVVFFDVGQGDAAVVRFADGRSILIDTGGGGSEADTGRRILVRELARLGIFAPTVLVLSHPDRDHAYGAFGLVESMTPNALVLHGGERFATQGLVPPLLSLAALRRVPVRFVDRPTRWAFGTDSVELRPVTTGEPRNGNQLGLDVRLGPCRFVLLGDMTVRGERQWLSGAAAGRAHVFKVSHHGSRTSSASELVEVLRPCWAVVSAGVDNRYGHPDPDVVERFRQKHADVLRTDFHGAVRFRLRKDGRLSCTSARGPCGTITCTP